MLVFHKQFTNRLMTKDVFMSEASKKERRRQLWQLTKEHYQEESYRIEKSGKRLRILLGIVIFCSFFYFPGFFVAAGIYVYAKRKEKEKYALEQRYLDEHNLALPASETLPIKGFGTVFGRFFDRWSTTDEEPIEYPVECLSCHTQVYGNYCPNCGQSVREHKIEWKQLFVSMFGDAINLEENSFSTIFELFTRPGKMLREYLDGKRSSYENPVKLWLLLSAIYTIIQYYFPDPYMFVSDGSSFENFFAVFAQNDVIWKTVILLFVQFYPTYWCFRRIKGESIKYSKPEIFTVLMYALSIDFVINIVLTPLESMFPDSGWTSFLGFLLGCIRIGYLLFLLKQFFELSWWNTLIRYIGSYILMIVFAMVSFLFLAGIQGATNNLNTNNVTDYIISKMIPIGTEYVYPPQKVQNYVNSHPKININGSDINLSIENQDKKMSLVLTHQHQIQGEFNLSQDENEMKSNVLQLMKRLNDNYLKMDSIKQESLFEVLTSAHCNVKLRYQYINGISQEYLLNYSEIKIDK